MKLSVDGLYLEEVEEILQLVREIEQRDPSRSFYCAIEGLEDKTKKEAEKIIREMFPKRITAS